MKIKILFCSIIFLSLFNMAQGQGFYGGVMVGLNGSQVAGDELSGYHKAGFFGGGFVGWRFTEMSALRMELEFSQKGSKEAASEENGYFSYLLAENCIDLPILYQGFFHIKQQQFSFEAGLSYTYIIGDPKEEYASGDGFSGGIPPGTSHPFVPSSLNIVLGVYYHVTKNFFINLRTSDGLTPIRKDQAISRHRLGGRGQYNDLLTFSIGWDFGKGAIQQ